MRSPVLTKYHGQDPVRTRRAGSAQSATRVARVRIAHTIDCELPTAEFQISHGTNATQETLNVTMSRRDYVVDIGRAVGIVPMCCKVVGVIDVILAPVS